MAVNKILQGLYNLDHNIKLYIPSTSKINQSASTQAYTDEALALFGQSFGGATCYDAIGSWVSPEAGLVTEGIKIVESYASKEDITKCLKNVISLALKIKRELEQEAVSLEYDNKLYLV